MIRWTKTRAGRGKRRYARWEHNLLQLVFFSWFLFSGPLSVLSEQQPQEMHEHDVQQEPEPNHRSSLQMHARAIEKTRDAQDARRSKRGDGRAHRLQSAEKRGERAVGVSAGDDRPFDVQPDILVLLVAVHGAAAAEYRQVAASARRAEASALGNVSGAAAIAAACCACA